MSEQELAILFNAFPFFLKEDVAKVIAILPKNKFHMVNDIRFVIPHLVNDTVQPIMLNGEFLAIPYRVYFDEPDPVDESVLTDIQKIILNCIYLRHNNGFIRQRRLQLLAVANWNFVVPFTFPLLGEYVIEILFVLDAQLNKQNIGDHVRFIEHNEKYWQQIQSRVISYWSEYYRKKYPILREYIGMQIVNRIKLAGKQL